MSAINSCRFLGRVVGDPKVRRAESGLVIAEFRMAMNSRYKAKDGKQVEKTEYIDLKCFGGQAEVVEAHFTKGRLVLVETRYELEQWEKDGVPQSRPRFILESFEFCDRPKSESSSSGNSDGQ